jgi:hypothetical protein
MKRILNLLALLMMGGMCSAQLINDGGTITIQSGAVLYVETDVTNNTVGGSTGTITVEGTLEVQGDLINNATMTTANGSLVKFSGTDAADFKSNGAIIENMLMEKDHATTGTVTLLDELSILTNLDFTPATNANQLILDAFDLKLTAQATTITNPSANDYIVADAAGMVEKTTDADGLFTFPVGDAGAYSPIDVDYSGSGYAAANVRVNLDDVVHPNKPTDGDDFIERYWNVNQNNITGYAATLTGTYDAADVIGGSAGDIYGATQVDGAGGMAVSDWDFSGTNQGASTVTADVTDDSDLTGFNFFGKADLKVFLNGAYSGGTMNTTLPGIAGFPLTTPYTVAPWNAPSETAGSVPANTTDWILIEARDASTPATVLAQKSGFLLNDGSIVDLDGGDLLIKDAEPTSIIAVRHRNHLGVRTDAGYDMLTASLFDFTTGTGVYVDGGISNTNMKDVSGTKTLWSGNANSDNIVQYNGGGLNDRIKILIGVGANNTTPSAMGYHFEDVNMDGFYQYNGGGLNDRIAILINVGANNTTPITEHN